MFSPRSTFWLTRLYSFIFRSLNYLALCEVNESKLQGGSLILEWLAVSIGMFEINLAPCSDPRTLCFFAITSVVERASHVLDAGTIVGEVVGKQCGADWGCIIAMAAYPLVVRFPTNIPPMTYPCSRWAILEESCGDGASESLFSLMV